ncbi:hypothetical protein AAF712_007824 [Marasmius tenuissimus]|uniref:DUF6535 domain-containing protein n=1 Tax=Marasmius tenuissimus TaxID=585030 RepID=A0ABR2ZWJ2_9AGAR
MAPLDPISAKKVLPRAMDKAEDENESGTGSEEKKKASPTGNEDTATEAPVPSKPTLEKSWEVIMKEVTALDEGLVGGWKEDIDTLLVFAGLFSAVVTAFTIESYQWLQEAPEDTTVVLLKQISQQLNGSSVPDPDEFTVSSSVVAINVLWFLSLILALVDALFALLCKQWLREHRRHTHTRTPSEALALRWLRHQSLEKWYVPTILASLPMLLEIALFLFLAGLLELLRTRHPVLFKLATIVVAFAALFYLATTIVPAVNIIRQALQVTPELREMRIRTDSCRYSPADFIMTLPAMEYICPYKSPQAWATFQILRHAISRILGPLKILAFVFWERKAYFNLPGSTEAFRETVISLLNWSSVDLELLQRSSIDLAPPFYELDAFRWLVTEFRDIPHMLPHLQNILLTTPLHLVMPAVLDQWFFLPGRKWTISDIETALAPDLPRSGIENHLSYAKRQVLTHGRRTGHFSRLLHWAHISINGGNDGGRDSPLFPIPFGSIDAKPDDGLRGRLWDIYTEIIQSSTASNFPWATVMEDLAPYIIASSPDYALHVPTATTTSPFVSSAAGYEFLHKLHVTILKRYAFESRWANPSKIIERDYDDNVTNWMEAMDIVRRVHDSPKDHFWPFPGYFPLPLSKLRKTLNGLSLEDSDIDFGYLDTFQNWRYSDVSRSSRSKLVEILSEHINNSPQSDTGLSHCPGKTGYSPLVMSSAGLTFITFVNDCMADRWQSRGFEARVRTGWRDAIELVKLARPELPPDHFKDIFHEGADTPAHEHSSQQEFEVGAQAGDPGGSHNHETVSRSNSEPSPGAQPIEDKRGPLLEKGHTDQEGRITGQSVVSIGDPASGGADDPLQGKMVGGPNADKNV